MKQSIIIAALALFLIDTFFSSSVFAESQADKYLGERKGCLNAVSIKDTLILDDQSIIFEMYGGAIYLSYLPAECKGLWVSKAFSYTAAGSKLCKQDVIEIVDQGPFRGTRCGLGEFVLIKTVSRLRDAKKLLKDGVLEALAKEGVFEIAFPSKKSE